MSRPLVDRLRERAEEICPTAAPVGTPQIGHQDADLMTAAANAMTAGLSAVDLHTPNGWRLSFVQRDVPGECVGCGAPGPVTAGEERIAVAGRALPPIGVEDLVDVQIDQGRSGDTLTLCGGCVAEGLAIVLGRRHVQHGGNVADLRDAAGTRLPRRDDVIADGRGALDDYRNGNSAPFFAWLASLAGQPMPTDRDQEDVWIATGHDGVTLHTFGIQRNGRTIEDAIVEIVDASIAARADASPASTAETDRGVGIRRPTA